MSEKVYELRALIFETKVVFDFSDLTFLADEGPVGLLYEIGLKQQCTHVSTQAISAWVKSYIRFNQ